MLYLLSPFRFWKENLWKHTNKRLKHVDLFHCFTIAFLIKFPYFINPLNSPVLNDDSIIVFGTNPWAKRCSSHALNRWRPVEIGVSTTFNFHTRTHFGAHCTHFHARARTPFFGHFRVVFSETQLSDCSRWKFMQLNLFAQRAGCWPFFSSDGGFFFGSY